MKKTQSNNTSGSTPLRLGLPILAFCCALMVISGTARAQSDLGATAPTPGAGDISSILTSASLGPEKPDALNYYDDNGFNTALAVPVGLNSPGQTFVSLTNGLLTSVAYQMGANNGTYTGGGSGTGPGLHILRLYSLSGPGSTTATLLSTYQSSPSYTFTAGDWIKWSGLSLQVTNGGVYAYTISSGTNAGAGGGATSPMYCRVYDYNNTAYPNGSICLIQAVAGPSASTVTYDPSSSAPQPYNQNFDIGFSAVPHSATIALQDGSTAISDQGSATATNTTVVTAGASVLVVCVEDHGATVGSEPATLTWTNNLGTVNTLIRAVQEDHTAGTTRGSAIYYCYDPSPGTNVLSVTVGGGANDVGISSYTLSGVNDTAAPLAGGNNSGGAFILTYDQAGVTAGSWAAVNATFATQNGIPVIGVTNDATAAGVGSIRTTINANASSSYTAGYVTNITAGSDLFTCDWTGTGNGSSQKANFGTVTFAPAPFVLFSLASATPNPVVNGQSVTVSIKAVSFAPGGAINHITVDASSVGGSSVLPLVLSATANVYTNSVNAVVAASILPDLATVIVTASDNQGNTNTANVPFAVVGTNEIWNGASSPNTWATAGNWVGKVPVLGDQTTFAGTTQTNVNMESSYTISGLAFSNNAGIFNITNAANALVLTAGSSVVNNSTNTQTLSVPVNLGSAATNGIVTLKATSVSGNLVLNQPLADGSFGPGGLTAVGPGTNVLSGVSTYTGNTTITSGTLAITGLGQLGSGTYVGNILDTGVLNYSSTAAQTLSGIISGTGGALTVNTVPGSILTLNGGTIPEAYTGPTVVNGGELDLNFNNQGTSGIYTSSSLTINTNSIVRLLNDNALNGSSTTIGSLPVTINAGGLLTGNHSSHIRGKLTLNGGTLDADGGQNAAYGTWDLDDGLTVPGSVNTSTISALTVVPSQANGTIFNITNGGTASGIDLNVTGTLIFGTSLADTGIIKNGSGTMQLNGANTYTGNTTINGGTIILADPAQLVGPSGTYAGAITNNGTFISTTTAPQAQNMSGIISGTGTLMVGGSSGSSLTLSGPDSYTGNTIITNGTLFLISPGTIANSAHISVSRGATFDVSGATSPTLGVNQSLFGIGTINAPSGLGTSSSSIIAPSNEGATTVGAMTINGSLTLVGGATTTFAVSASHSSANDSIAVSGTLTLNNNVLRIKAPSAVANLDTSGDYVLISSGASSITGIFATTPIWDVAPANAANYTVVTSASSVNLHYSTVVGPLAVGQGNPFTNALRNNTVVLTVTVTNGSGANPAISSVIANETAVGGLSSVPLVLQSLSGAVSVWTNSVVIPTTTPPGLVSLPTAITDGNGNVDNINTTFTVVPSTEVWNYISGNLNWSSNPNWQSGGSPGLVGDSLLFAGTSGLGPVMNVNYTINGLAFSNNAGVFNITTNSSGSILTLAANSILTNSTALKETLNVPILLNGPVTLGSATNGNLVVSQALVPAVPGTSTVTTYGPGTNTLGGLNTYIATTTIKSGTLTIGPGGDLGDTGGAGGAYATNIVDTGVLNYTGTNNQILSGVISGTGGGLTLNSPVGTVLTIGPGLTTANTPETYTGPTVVNSGELDMNFENQPTSGIYLSSSLTINSNGIVAVLGSSALMGYTGQAANLPVTINAGGLLNVPPSATGFSAHLFGVVNLNGGTLAQNAANNQQYGGWEIDNQVNVNGGKFTSIISDPEFVLGQAGGTVFNVTNGGTASGVDLDVTGALVSTTATPGTGLIVKGNGTMQLDGLNTYVNSTTISNGATLILGPGGQLNNGGSLFDGNPGDVVYTGIYATNINNNGTFVSETTNVTPVTQTLAGVISGTGTLKVSGAGAALILSASNTYTGSTLILNHSTLFLAAGGSIKNSSVVGVTNGAIFDYSALGSYTVPAGQTLRGSGTVNGGAVTVNGNLSAGDVGSIGTLNLNNNNLTFGSGGSATLRINKTAGVRTSDLVTSINAASYSGTLIVTNTGVHAFNVGDTFTLFSAASASGNFAGITGIPGTTFTFNPSTGVLTVVSVPSTIPTPIIFSRSGGNLNLSWPSDHLGWDLQTNSTSLTIPTNWFTLPGSASVTSEVIPIVNATNVFFRLHYNP